MQRYFSLHKRRYVSWTSFSFHLFMFFPSWLRVKFIAAPGNHLQLVFWGESWSKPHFILPACWTEHMATLPPVQPRKRWWDCAHIQEMLPHHPKMSTDMLRSLTRTALLTTEPHLRWLTMLTSSLSPCMDFSLTRALTAPLTRISSATWNLRMLASSLALPGGRKHSHLQTSAFASRISCAGMELHGKHHNFLKVQRN